jgi:hypothetical protein
MEDDKMVQAITETFGTPGGSSFDGDEIETWEVWVNGMVFESVFTKIDGNTCYDHRNRLADAGDLVELIRIHRVKEISQIKTER